MIKITYISLDQRYRVVERNFWYVAQQRWAGRWRDMPGASRNQDALTGFLTSLQNHAA